MRSPSILGVSCLLLLCAAVSSQQTYDGRNGPHVFGPPGQQTYIRGQNEGSYQVPGVGGTFQNSPSTGAHVYTDEQGTTYVNRKNGPGQPNTHTISGPQLVAQRGYNHRPGSEPLQRSRRGFVASRPDRVVVSDGSSAILRRNRRDFHVGRPDRTVDYSNGNFVIQRARRSPQSVYAVRPDGRSVGLSPGGVVASGYDGRTVQHARHRRQSVQGDNFVARPDQAGVWNDNVSVWRRPDGRTVTLDQNGNAITSGSPNGRGPQHYSG